MHYYSMSNIHFSAKSTKSSKRLSKRERHALRKRAAKERRATKTAEGRQSAELREDQPPEAQGAAVASGRTNPPPRRDPGCETNIAAAVADTDGRSSATETVEKRRDQSSEHQDAIAAKRRDQSSEPQAAKVKEKDNPPTGYPSPSTSSRSMNTCYSTSRDATAACRGISYAQVVSVDGRVGGVEGPGATGMFVGHPDNKALCQTVMERLSSFDIKDLCIRKMQEEAAKHDKLAKMHCESGIRRMSIVKTLADIPRPTPVKGTLVADGLTTTRAGGYSTARKADSKTGGSSTVPKQHTWQRAGQRKKTKK